MASETQQDPERIYLEPAPGSPEGRMWCEDDDVWQINEGLTGVEYIRADLHAAEIARLTAELDAATEALRDAFGAICPGYAYESPRQAARTIVSRYVRTENVLLEEIDGLRRELDAAREREREANETIDLAWQFVTTARRDFRPGDEEYDDCLEQVEDLLWRARKDALSSTPPDTEGDDV